jgi:hypothetical protein
MRHWQEFGAHRDGGRPRQEVQSQATKVRKGACLFKLGRGRTVLTLKQPTTLSHSEPLFGLHPISFASPRAR